MRAVFTLVAVLLLATCGWRAAAVGSEKEMLPLHYVPAVPHEDIPLTQEAIWEKEKLRRRGVIERVKARMHRLHESRHNET